MSRLPAVAFVGLVAATVAAFFITQHLKVTTPLIAGAPRPSPAIINPVAGQTCGGLNHRVMRISFYLLHRSDVVDVYVVDQSGNIVATLATNRRMRRGVRIPDGEFSWNGFEDTGQIAPDGTYYIRVALIHQGRTVTLSGPDGPEPVKVLTRPPAPRVIAVTPQLIPQRGRRGAVIHYTGNQSRGGTVQLYRTDLPGRPRLVKSFLTPWKGQTAVWDGLIKRRPAPAGVYLVGLDVTDAGCNTGHFPSTLPPSPGSTPGAGVTVRYLAAQPPLDPVPAGSRPTVYVDSRGVGYDWSLGTLGAGKAIASGRSDRYALRVPLPRSRAGAYVLSLRSGTHSTSVPVVASATAPARALVVLPALTWQGLDPVDDDGDGLPDTLADGQDILLARPLVDGLPAGFSAEAGFLAYLGTSHYTYDLQTDLGLVDGVGPRLSGHQAVILAGSEEWIPASLASALRTYVQHGGHVISLGIDSLRRYVTVSRGRASAPTAPTAPSAVDALGARIAPVVKGNRELIGVLFDQLGIFSTTSGVLSGFSQYQPISSVASPGRIVSEAGTSPASPAVVAYRLGAGTVADVGLVGYGSRLGSNVDARELWNRLWAVLVGG